MALFHRARHPEGKNKKTKNPCINHHLIQQMEKTSSHFPLVLLYIVAVYLLSAALWTAEGTGGTAGGTGASHLLDGKTFITQTGEKGKKADHQDVISFRDGKFISEGCVKYGFEEKTFTATTDGDVIRFRAENVSPKLGIMLWEGTVKGDVFEATSTWIRDRWYWKIKREYWYRGRLKE